MVKIKIRIRLFLKLAIWYRQVEILIKYGKIRDLARMKMMKAFHKFSTKWPPNSKEDPRLRQIQREATTQVTKRKVTTQLQISTVKILKKVYIWFRDLDVLKMRIISRRLWIVLARRITIWGQERRKGRFREIWPLKSFILLSESTKTVLTKSLDTSNSR